MSSSSSSQSSRSSKSSLSYSSASSSSRSSSSSSSWEASTSSQTESTSTSSSSVSSASSSTSSEIKATQLEFSFRGTKWSKSKLLCTGIPAIKNIYDSNKQCQIIKIPFTKYTIEYASLFLRKLHEDSSMHYDLVLELYDTDENGLPKTLISFSTISSNVVNEADWYYFDFAGTVHEKTTPENQLLALVFYQNGGDEKNFVNWYYSLDVNGGTKSYVSKDDGVIWTEQPEMTRAIRISDIFDIFEEAYVDSNLHSLTFPPGQDAKSVFSGSNYLNFGEFYNTYVNEQEAISLKYKQAIVSLIVDSSGSMGWNDRYLDRITAVQNLINDLKVKYPNKVLFDVILFGSYRVEALDFDSSTSYTTTKLDLNNPSGYTLNNDGTIPSLQDGLVSWGLSDLENGHEYIISSIVFSPSQISLEDGIGTIIPDLNIYAPINYQNIGNQNIPIQFSIENKGVGSEKSPEKAKSATVCRTNTLNTNDTRKPFSLSRKLNVAFVTKDVKKGDTEIFVDSYDAFGINETVDIFNQNNIQTGIKIVRKETINNENKVVLESAINFDFKNSFSEDGSLLQESSVYNAFYPNLNDTMIELLVKDASVTRNVVFYFQTLKGGFLKWEFKPQKQWESLLLTYAGDTASLNMDGVDSDGNFLPNGTRIDLYVDKDPQTSESKNLLSFFKLKTPVKSGENTFSVYETDPNTKEVYDILAKNMYVILRGTVLENKYTNRYEITNIKDVSEYDEINPSEIINKKIVTFTPTHSEIWEANEFLLETVGELPDSLKIDMPISAVDISPIAAGRKLDPSYLEIQDPPQVDPSSNPNDFNQSRERKRDNSINIPLIGGIGRIRTLPITEDLIETTEEKNKKASQFQEDTSLTEEEKIERQLLFDEYLKQINGTKQEVQKSINPPETTTETVVTTTDYTIDSPVFLQSGKAISHMKVTAKTMEKMDFENFKINFIDDESTKGSGATYSSTSVLVNTHTVYPCITIKTNKKTIIQKTQPIYTYFIAPVQISSCVVGPVMFYCRWDDSLIEPGQVGVDIPYVYAISEDSIKIHYNVYYKNVFLKQGKMRIKIFDVTRTPIEMLNPSEKYVDLNNQAYNGIPTSDSSNTTSTNSSSSTYYQKPEQSYFFHEDVNNLYINSTGFSEATYLPGYQEGGYVVDIINGRAVLEIKSSLNINFMAHLRVFAEILAPNDNRRSTIMQNDVFIANPLKITPLINGYEIGVAETKYEHVYPRVLCPDDNRQLLDGDGKTIYNFGAKVTWLGKEIEDNISVEFQTNPHKRSGGSGVKPVVNDNSDIDTLNYLEQMKTIVETAIKSGGTYSGIENDINSLKEMGNNTQNTQDKFLTEDQPNVTENNIGLWAPTPTSPNISKTISGIAEDVYIGPHEQVTPHWVEVGQETPPNYIEMGDIENIIIKTSYNGIYNQVTINPMWMGKAVGEEGESNKLHVATILYKNSKVINSIEEENHLWADGWEHLVALLDLSVSYIGGYPLIQEITPYLVGDIKIANEQLKPVSVKFDIFGNGTFAKSKPIDPITNQPLELIVQDTTNIPIGWAVATISKSFIPVKPKEPDPSKPKCQECYPYACTKMEIKATINGSPKVNQLLGCGSLDPIGCQCVDSEGHVSQKDWIKPIVYWKDPLQGEMSVISDDEEYILDKLVMDGKNRTRVDVEFSFSGLAIPIVAKKHGVVKFTKADYDQKTTASKNQYMQSSFGTNSIASNVLDQISTNNIVENDYYDTMFNYYANIIKEGAQNQTSGNKYLIKYRSKTTVAWKDYFPKVVFKLFIGTIKTNEETGEETIINQETPSCLTLTQYEAKLSIQYTSDNISSDQSQTETTEIVNHFHECSVDEQGNGSTTKTFKKDTYQEIDNHTHYIENFVVLNSTDKNAIHFHEVKSTTCVYVNPFTLSDLGFLDENSMIFLKASLEYDASKDFVERHVDLTMSFDPYDGIVPKDKRWKLILNSPNEAYVQKSTTNNDEGFNVDVELSQGYYDEHQQWVPVNYAPDGTRTQIEIQPFITTKTEGDYQIIKESLENPYITIEYTAKAIIEGQKVKSKSQRVYVWTNMQWLPKVKQVLPYITDDNINLNNAINKIESVGGSPLNDAIMVATSRIKNYYFDNIGEDFFPCIMMFTDGDENMSNFGLSESVSVLNIGLNIPIFSIGLGNINPISKNLLNTYAIETGGSIVEFGSKTLEEVEEQTILAIQSQQMNSGTYANIIQLPDSFYIKEITPFVHMETNSKMTIRFQIGNSTNNFGLWSESFDITGDIPINIEAITQDTKNKFVKYKIEMFGNENFKSPLFFGCSSLYLQPKYCKVFSQPIKTNANVEQIISEITITHKTTNSNKTNIQYGFCPLNSTNELDYYNNYNLPFNSGERYIILSRSGELMLSQDGQTYKAQNGPWNEGLSIKIFTTNYNKSYCDLVNEDEYAVYPNEGKISFYKKRNITELILLSIDFPNEFRILCKVENNSIENTYIDHIGLMYNIATKKSGFSGITIQLNLISTDFKKYKSASNLSSIDISTTSLYVNGIITNSYQYNSTTQIFTMSDTLSSSDVVSLNIPTDSIREDEISTFVFGTRIYPSDTTNKIYYDPSLNSWNIIDPKSVKVYTNGTEMTKIISGGRLNTKTDYSFSQTANSVAFTMPRSTNDIITMTYSLNNNLINNPNFTLKPQSIKNNYTSIVYPEDNGVQKYNWKFWPPPWPLYTYSQEILTDTLWKYSAYDGEIFYVENQTYPGDTTEWDKWPDKYYSSIIEIPQNEQTESRKSGYCNMEEFTALWNSIKFPYLSNFTMDYTTALKTWAAANPEDSFSQYVLSSTEDTSEIA